MPFDRVGITLICIALLLLAAVFAINRIAFAGDSFARKMLWAIALPISAYLLRLSALHWVGAT